MQLIINYFSKRVYPLPVVALLCYILFMSTTPALAQSSAGKKISPDLFGLFFEDINYAADGGLYAELVQNRSFEYNPAEQRNWHPFSFWEYLTPGFSYGKISVETESPVHPNNPHYIDLDVLHVGHEEKYEGISGVGLKNPGFNGMVVRQGEKYHFSLFARLISAEPINLWISLQNKEGEILVLDSVLTTSDSWEKYTSSLVATADCDSAALVILARNKGKLSLDMISLFPENTFKNRENGLRADLAQALADLQAKFIRFPGGCLVHGDGLENMYRWKNTIGPLEARVGQRNIWGYHQTAGLGYFEYFQFCEDVGAMPLPVLPAAVSCQNSGGTWSIGGTGQKALPLDEMDDYIQEVFDLIEWANGPATSEWGSKRAAAGHPETFDLEYIGIGNEDKITPEFEERFTMIYDAVKEKHPEITIIGTVGPGEDGEDFIKGWKYAKDINIPIIDEHYYKNPEWFMSNLHRYDAYDRDGSKVYLGEYATWGNKLLNAIAEAAYLTALEQNGDIVMMASYAPMLAKKGFTQWRTDMIFFDNNNIMLTPNYHVQKMFMNNPGDSYYDHIVPLNEKDTTLSVSCVMDSKTGDIILKLVNAGNEPRTMNVDLSGFKKLSMEAEKTILTGEAEDENTFENPDKVIPSISQIKIKSRFEYEAPAQSLTVLRIEAKK